MSSTSRPTPINSMIVAAHSATGLARSITVRLGSARSVPEPGAARRLGRLVIEQQLQLRRLDELWRATRDDFTARVGMSREHAVIAQQMETRRRGSGRRAER